MVSAPGWRRAAAASPPPTCGGWCPLRGEGVERHHGPLGACAVAPSGSKGLEPGPLWGLRRGGCWAGRTLRPGQLADPQTSEGRLCRAGITNARAPLAQGQGARWGRPGPCGPTGPASSGPGAGAGLDVLAPGDRPRGPGEDLLIRVAGADVAQPGAEGPPRRRWTARTIRQGAQVPDPGSAGALTCWWCGTLPAPPACRYRVGLRRMTVEVRSRKGLM